MRDIWFTFLTHHSVQFLMLSTVLCFAAVSLLDVWSYWPFALLVVVIAPFYEWVAHKYTLHLPLKQEASFIRRYQIRLHHGHHAEPERRDLQFAPASAIFLMFVQFYLSYALVAWLFGVNGWEAAFVPCLASLVYYLAYEWIHLAHHTLSYKPLTSWGRNMRQAHMLHHFHNENFNWGITNGLGDKVLGTWKDIDDVPRSPTAKSIAGYQH